MREEKAARQDSQQAPGGRNPAVLPESGSGSASLIVDFGLVILLALALLLVINPFPRWVAPPAVGENFSLPQVMAYRGGSWVIGVLLLFLVYVLGVARVRAHVGRSERLRNDVCPVCGSDDLRRIHRRWQHHVLNALGIPLRRYVCGNCQWRGARVDRPRQ